LFAFRSSVGSGGVLDKLAALIQFLGDWYASERQVAWAGQSEELRLSGLSEQQLALARQNLGPLPRPWVSRTAARWLRRRGLLVLYRGQPALAPSTDFLSPIAKGERQFLGQTGLAASEQAAASLEDLGASPHEICARWDAEPVDAFWVPDRLKNQPLGGCGIPFSEHLPVAAGFAQGPGERVYVTVQQLTDSQEAGGWGFSWEAERVVLHRLPRRTVVISVPGLCFRHTDPPG
jgi:hypothetical protein